MVTILEKVSNDEIIISVKRFIFTTTRRYVKVDENIWYNKDLRQEVTDYEMDNLDIKELIYGKK